MHVQGHDLPMTPKEPGIKVLGSLISFTGSCVPGFKARSAAAWKNFFKHRPMLCHRAVSIKQKLHPLHVVIRPCLLWAVCTLTLTAAFLKSLDVLQLSMVSIVTRRGRNHDEGWLEWFINTRREARKLIKDEGYRTWSNDALFAYYMWAGHVARLPRNRYAALAHQHADLQWWKQRQALIELLPDGYQGRHPGTFPPRRWEDRVFQLIDTEAFKCTHTIRERYSNWRELAQDRDLYRSVVQAFLQTVG